MVVEQLETIQHLLFSQVINDVDDLPRATISDGVDSYIDVITNQIRNCLDVFIPHQANLRIIDATARRMGLSTDKVMINIQKYGNTTNGTIPMCLYEWEERRFIS